MNLISPCWKPFGHGDNSSAGIVGGREGKDGLLWFRDIGKYGSGEFSMAVVQANQVLEDQSQIESGPLGTFVGVYDGHGGPDASRYVCDHLFRNFQGSQFYSYVGLVEFNSRSWSLLWNLLFLVILVICGFHGFAFSEHLFLSFIFLLFTRIKSSWKMHGDTVLISLLSRSFVSFGFSFLVGLNWMWSFVSVLVSTTQCDKVLPLC